MRNNDRRVGYIVFKNKVGSYVTITEFEDRQGFYFMCSYYSGIFRDFYKLLEMVDEIVCD